MSYCNARYADGEDHRSKHLSRYQTATSATTRSRVDSLTSQMATALWMRPLVQIEELKSQRRIKGHMQQRECASSTTSTSGRSTTGEKRGTSCTTNYPGGG